MTILFIFISLFATAQDQIKVIDKSREPDSQFTSGQQQLTPEQQVEAKKMLEQLKEYKQKVEENNKALEKLMDEN